MEASLKNDPRPAARLALVREHVHGENAHDLDAIMATFGDTAQYDDEPWNEHHTGRNGVRAYYEGLIRSVPDLQIDVQREHVTPDHVILEVIIRGTHIGTWRGLPGTGRTLAIPLCGIFAFDGNDRLASERIYYDRGTVLRQLGVFHDPESIVGRLTTVLTHPVTVVRLAVHHLTSIVRSRR
ncbi:MAG TPA: ester cyclase [Candidatus Babeliales bacterium]|nr:ester cyclase [Candidatus Babeliales bacterium]